MNKQVSKRLLVVSKMPPLEHWVGKLGGDEFDLGKSEVVKWLSGQGDVMYWLVDMLSDRGLIVYDAAVNRWSGQMPEKLECGRGGGRPRDYDPEVLLLVADAEPDGVVVGRRAWYAKVQEKSPMSTMTFNRMVDRLIKEGRVAFSSQFPEKKTRFPGKKTYWRATVEEQEKLGGLSNAPKIIPDSIPEAVASETTASESST